MKHTVNLIRVEGRADYAEMLRRQQETARAVEIGAAPGTVFLLEHAPTITLGRRANRANVLADAETLARAGVALVETDRGGDATYHGPGQLVVYPILNLTAWRPSVDWYLRGIEETVVRLLRHYGLTGERLPGYTGVWVRGAKVAAIGVSVRQWVSRHGLALNVAPNMEHWNLIIPCGIADKPITSLDRLLPSPPPMSEVMDCWEQAFLDVFSCERAAHG